MFSYEELCDRIPVLKSVKELEEIHLQDKEAKCSYLMKFKGIPNYLKNIVTITQHKIINEITMLVECKVE